MLLKYRSHPGGFVINFNDLYLTAHSLRYTLKHIRGLGGLPLDNYEQKALLSNAVHAQKGIIDAPVAVRINIGGN